MTRLTNFALGGVLAGLLMGPAGWAGARQAVAHAGVSVAAMMMSASAPQARTEAVVRTAVRSALQPTP